MSVYFDQAKKRWRFDFSRRFNGQRYRTSKLLPAGWSRDQAEAYDRAQCARLYAQAVGLEKPRRPLAGAVQLYLDHRCPQLRNGKKAAQDLAHLITDIEAAWLDEVAQLATRYELAHPELAPGTVRNRLAYLKAAVRYAYRKHHYGDRDHSDRMQLPAANNERQRYEKLPALNKLWRALPPEARALFKAAFYMGLRWRAELLPRQPADIVRVDGAAWLKIGITKNGLPIMKPVHPAARDCLKHLPFQHNDTWFYKQWHAAMAQLGLKDFRPHDLRHSLASEIRARGGTLEDVQGALHQVSRQSAERYAHLYPERLKAVIFGVGVQKLSTPKKQGKSRSEAK